MEDRLREEDLEGRHPLVKLIFAGIIIMVIGIALALGGGVMGSVQTSQLRAFPKPIAGESYSLVNGTNITVVNLGNGIASLDLYNSDRTVHYIEGQNYTLDPSTGNVGLFNILS